MTLYSLLSDYSVSNEHTTPHSEKDEGSMFLENNGNNLSHRTETIIITITFSTDKNATSSTNEVSAMVIILAKLGSNINYGQGKRTVVTSPVGATPNTWEGDVTVDKAQFYKLNLHILLHQVTKAQEGTEVSYTHSMHHYHARRWFQIQAPSDCYPLH
jgi:hypothetical protein